jgi:ElaB/YqjD/DUF883 family membrane-anchored ribosome-binding protein
MSITETARDAADHAASNGRHLMDKAGKSARKFADQVGERLDSGELAHEVEARTRKYYSLMKTQVQERPGVAVGIAAGAGVLVGLLLAAGRRS